MNKERIGFIGVGAMGRPMAKNLLKAGYPLTVYDLNPEPIKEVVACGAKAASSSAQAARDVEVIITMLPACDEVKAAVLGAGGVLEGANEGTLLIDMSSIAPHTSRLVASRAAKVGVKFLDAPVSGGVTAAEKGTLTIIVGGDRALLDEHMDLMQAMGKTIYHVGDVGMGETVKMINQVLAGINMLAIAEAFVLGTKLGADPETIYKVIRVSAGNSFLIDARVPDYVLKGDFSRPGFALDLMLKDLGLAIESAKINKIPLFLTGQAYQYFSMASSWGLGKKDMSSVTELLEEIVRVKVRTGSE
jgi:2-hydroxymethylglutarate dehydrogenase